MPTAAENMLAFNAATAEQKLAILMHNPTFIQDNLPAPLVKDDTMIMDFETDLLSTAMATAEIPKASTSTNFGLKRKHAEPISDTIIVDQTMHDLKNEITLNKLIDEHDQWHSVVWHCKDHYEPTGDVVALTPSLPAKAGKNGKKSFGEKITGWDINGDRRIVHKDLAYTRVEKWVCPLALGNALYEADAQLKKEIGACVKLANCEDFTTIVTYHHGHWHMLIGHDGSLFKTQAYKSSCGMNIVKRKIRHQHNPLAYILYMLCDKSKKYLGCNSTVGVTGLHKIFKYLKENEVLMAGLSDMSEPGENEIADVKQVVQYGIKKQRIIEEVVDELQEDLECKSSTAVTTYHNGFMTAATTKKSNNLYSKKVEQRQANIDTCIKFNVFDTTNLYKSKRPEIFPLTMLQPNTLTTLFLQARHQACDINNRIDYIEHYEEVKHADIPLAMRTFFELPADWQSSVLSVCAMILLIHTKKTNLVWIHGKPNVGKSHWFSHALRWLQPLNKSIKMGGNFAFGLLQYPALLCIQDDVGVIFDNEQQIELFKNAASFDDAVVDGKYAAQAAMFQQGMLVLSNKSQIQMIGTSDMDCHMAALKKRYLWKAHLKYPVFNCKLSTVSNMWQGILHLLCSMQVEALTPDDLECAGAFMFNLLSRSAQ